MPITFSIPMLLPPVDGDGLVRVFQQMIPVEIETNPQSSTLIVHYVVNLDLLDSADQIVASRTIPKQLKIILHSLDALTDTQGFLDTLAEQYEVLAEVQRSKLIAAISELREQSDCGNSISRADSMQIIVPNLTGNDVDEFLHGAPQIIHWGDESERIHALSTLAELAQIDRNLPRIIQQEPLINTLVNGLKTFAVSSLSACSRIMAIFERMSYYQHYAEFLARFKIGATTLSLFHAQIALRNVAEHNLSKEKLNGYLASQNQLLKLIVSLLFNISESPSAMRKMVNKDILTPLSALFDRRNADLLILTFRFIRKIAIVPVNWAAVPYEQIPPAIARYIFRWGQVSSPEGRLKRICVLRESLELIHAFSFHSEAIEVIKQDFIFEGMSTLVDIPELRSQLIRIFYCCSIGETSDEVFRRDKVVNMLIMATTVDCDERMVSLIILSKLSLDREISLAIGKSQLFNAENLKTMFVQATRTESEENTVLLKLIHNVADNQPDLVRGFDAEIVKACTQNLANPAILTRVLSIANCGKMNSERAKF
jgi:hypothetical protein